MQLRNESCLYFFHIINFLFVTLFFTFLYNYLSKKNYFTLEVELSDIYYLKTSGFKFELLRKRDCNDVVYTFKVALAHKSRVLLLLVCFIFPLLNHVIPVFANCQSTNQI